MISISCPIFELTCGSKRFSQTKCVLNLRDEMVVH